MNSSSLEITENQYCIKLSKDTFDLSLVRQLIKRIQAEELFFSRKNESLDDIPFMGLHFHLFISCPDDYQWISFQNLIFQI
mgnify:CR=1 FL=1